MREVVVRYFPLVSLTFITAFLSVAFFVPSLRDFAHRIGAVQEGGGRRVHAGMMPNIGGIAIFAGFLIALMVGSIAHSAVRYEPESLAHSLLSVS